MLCPVCAVELVIAERQGIEIDYCPSCRGIWLDRGELDKIAERTSAYTSDAPPEGYRGGKKHPYRGTHHHDRESVEEYPSKPKRGYKGGKKHRHRGTHYHDREYEYGDRRRYDDDDRRRYKKSKKRRASDLLEDLFDIFD